MIDQSNRPAPPSSEYEVFHSDELTGKILPEGALYFEDYAKWVKSRYVGSSPVWHSWYAIPRWRTIDKCDDVLPEGWQYRMRGQSEWRNGSRLEIGKYPANLQQCEYRAPTLPMEEKAEQGTDAAPKRTLWAKASERQPPDNLNRPIRSRGRTAWTGAFGRPPYCDTIEWLDLNAADAIEAERDKLAKENEKLRADNAFLNEAIDAAIKDRDHFEAEADRLRARIAEIEREVAPRKTDCATNPARVHGVSIASAPETDAAFLATVPDTQRTVTLAMPARSDKKLEISISVY